jgi:hypothetical protein
VAADLAAAHPVDAQRAPRASPQTDTIAPATAVTIEDPGALARRR